MLNEFRVVDLLFCRLEIFDADHDLVGAKFIQGKKQKF